MIITSLYANMNVIVVGCLFIDSFRVMVSPCDDIPYTADDVTTTINR